MVSEQNPIFPVMNLKINSFASLNLKESLFENEFEFDEELSNVTLILGDGVLFTGGVLKIDWICWFKFENFSRLT